MFWHHPQKLISNQPLCQLLKKKGLIPDVLNPRFSYAGGKLVSELLTINNFRNSITREIIFRPHNVFKARYGTRACSEIMKKLLKQVTIGQKKF